MIEVEPFALSSLSEASWDHVTATVMGLLFELTQQIARFGAAADPWNQLAVYDVDGFAPFTTEGRA
ncbi:hypothetical protein AB0E08_05425 [Streptomyces sp. NPDC048281]|uniref:hypothetical protein n=1 Tax=Streptomyces sp. NPDC048281 TaxID=3154715 RepID=UPI00341C872B